ncbi:unnamed protein product [Linum tenue]|nr:unnamed protein product [Linum tenue]
MEEDQVEVEQNDQFIIISTSETEDLLEEMLTISNNRSDHDNKNNEIKPERGAGAEEEGEVEETEKPVSNSIKSSSSSLRRASKRLAGLEPELDTLLIDPTPPRKTGKRSARQRSKLYTKSLEVPEMDIDKVEEKQAVENAEQQRNEQNGGVPPTQAAAAPPLRFHKEMLSKNCIQFALKVLRCEYEVTNEPEGCTAKQFYEEAMSDPFFEYACENVPDPSEILPPLGYYSMEKELDEFDRDVERCKSLPNFGFPMSFDSDVTVHFETPPVKGDNEFGNGKQELGWSGDQPKKGK